MSDLIDRKLAKDAIHKKLDGASFDGDLWHVADDIDDILDELPSAEKAQLSGEDATSVCKCPCIYREPCDVCHYDGHLGMGCPAEEGLKDE